MKWPALPFTKAISDVTGGNKKIQKKALLPEGDIPVVDQGQELIAGFTNDEAFFKGNIPIVLFGDHTRNFKYIDFPFALGADGVKALQAKEFLIPKFFYYYCQTINISSKGYSRHFKFLKQEKVPVFPLSEQRRIVEILDQADRLRKLRAEADKKAERILPALFIKMFGDPATKPMGWKTNPFEKLVEIGTQLVDPNREEYQSLPHIGGEHIESNTGRILPYEIVRDCKLRSNKFQFSSSHILYSKIRPYLNKVAFPQFDGLCSADIYPLIPKDDRITPWYLIVLLRSQAFLDYAKVHSDRLRIPKLNKTQLGAFEAPIPDQVTLMKFEKQAKEISTLGNSWDSRGIGIEKVFSVMLHRAFTGDLTASWREAHMKELLQEMEVQAKALAI